MGIFKFLAFVLLFTSLEAENCWRIQDKDQKALCESKYENQKFCWKIKDKDLQAYCEASVYRQKSCWKIKDNDMREMCKAETGN
jgi:hypothetical protein